MAGKAVAKRAPAKAAKPIEGKVVNKPRTGGQREQSTINVTYNINGEGGGEAGPGPIRRGNNWVQRQFQQEPQRAPLPKHVPNWLGNNKIVGYSWVTAMILIGFDEWHNHHILPRPSRFWYSSVVYAGLALISLIPPLVPIANALAIGYTFMLLWQYFNGEGQFTREAGPTVGEGEGSGGPLK